MDRVRAARFAVKCCQWIENPEIRKNCTSAVIGIRGSGIVFTDSEQLELQETDFDSRRSKVAWWSGLKKLGNILSILPLLRKCPNVLIGGRDVPDIVETSEKKRIEAIEAHLAEQANKKGKLRV